MADVYKVLVLGASGLLGNAVYRILSERNNLDVYGTIRNVNVKNFFSSTLSEKLIVVDNLENIAEMNTLLANIMPNVVINCLALSSSSAKEPIKLFSIFAFMPRRLWLLCRQLGIRLIQISSDGVFSGTRGGYTERDMPDAMDSYGMAKLLGEIDAEGAVTLRTSVIGPELGSSHGLLEWFLSQGEECRAYTRAIFSGFPSVVLAKVIRDEIIPRQELSGVYHLASTPISKFELLQMIAEKYGVLTRLVPDEGVVVDRSLVAERFHRQTGYVAPAWSELIDAMYFSRYGLKETQCLKTK